MSARDEWNYLSLLDTENLRRSLRIDEEACGLRVELEVRSGELLASMDGAWGERRRALRVGARPRGSREPRTPGIAEWESEGGTTE